MVSPKDNEADKVSVTEVPTTSLKPAEDDIGTATEIGIQNLSNIDLIPATIAARPSGAGGDDFPATQFGDYEILSEIARGGMGVVYKARQKQLNRTIALKMIRAGNLASPSDIKRFYTEAQAAAALEHSGIVPIYESGEQAGQHFYSMAFIDGESLHSRLKHGPLPPRTAAEIVRLVAEATQYAHEKGIVHRDLKPHNILLDADGKPKVTDFGLAKRLDIQDGMTATGEILGTPSYMAPEQALGQTAAIGPLSDVYALGAILYATLTGRPPFQAASLHETLRQVIEAEPVAPSLLNSATPRDLETICRKCLQKQPAQRYSSAAELADDLGRWLAGEPIRARPVGAWEQTLKWIARRPWIAAAYGLTVLTVVLVAVGATIAVFWQKAESARAIAETARNDAVTARNEAVTARDDALQARSDAVTARNQEIDARKRMEAALEGEQRARAGEQNALKELEESKAWNQYVLNVRLAPTLWDNGWVANARQALQDCPPQLRQWEWKYLNRKMNPELATMSGHTKRILDLKVSPDGQSVATIRDTARLWNAQTGEQIAVVSELDFFRSLAYHPDSGQLAVGTDGNFATNRPEVKNAVIVWDIRQHKQIRQLNQPQSVICLAYNHDGTLLAAGLRNGRVRVYNVADWSEIPVDGGHPGGVSHLVFHPNGMLISVCWNRALKFWDAASDKVRVRELMSATIANSGIVSTLELNATADRLMIVETNGTVATWDPEARKEITSFQLGCEVGSAAISPDRRRLIITNPERERVNLVKVWDLQTRQQMHSLSGHRAAVRAVAFSPDNQLMASSGTDGEVRVWDALTGKLVHVLRGHVSMVSALTFGNDGSRLYSADADGFTRIWDLTRPPDVIQLTDPMSRTGISLSNDGSRAAFVAPDRSLRVRNLLTGEDLGVWNHQSNPVVQIAISPDGSRVVGADVGNTIHLRDVTGNRPSVELKGHGGRINRLEFSVVGDKFASASDDATIRLWNAQTGQELATMRGHTQTAMTVAINPNGQQLASIGRDDSFRLWNLDGTEKMRSVWEYPYTVSVNDPVWLIRYSPDGSHVASANSGTMKVWDTVTGKQIAKIVAPTKLTWWEFSPDSRQIAYMGMFAHTYIWDFEQGKDVVKLLANSEFGARYSPDGTRLVGACADRSVRLWDTSNLQEMAALSGHEYPANRIQFDPSGSKLITAGFDGTVRRWQAEETSQEREERLTVRPRIWRQTEARRAEESQNWYAAAFHLGWLLRSQPEHDETRKRYENAVLKLNEQGFTPPALQ